MRNSAAVIMVLASMVFAGTIVAWGDDSYGQISDRPEEDYFAQVYSGPGAYHVVAVGENGEAVAWGRNIDGQCDIPSVIDDFEMATCARYYTTWITSDNIYSCGQPSWPPYGPYPSPFVEITSGTFFSMGIRQNGTLEGWGTTGQSPYGEDQIPDSLVDIGVVGIGAGSRHCLAILPDGHAVAWGNNSDGQCDVPSLYVFDKVVGGWEFSAGLRQNGAIAIWGNFPYGSFSGTGFVDVCAGDQFIIALRSDGTVDVLGSMDDAPDLPAGSSYVCIAAGDNFCVAVREDPSQGVEGSEYGISHTFTANRNPCRGLVSFRFQPQDYPRSLELHNLAGRRISVQEVPAGAEVIQWATGVPEGLYWAVLEDACTAFTVLK